MNGGTQVLKRGGHPGSRRSMGLLGHSRRLLSTTVRLSIWCDSAESVEAGAELLSKLTGTKSKLPQMISASVIPGFARVHVDDRTTVDLIAPPSVSRRRRMFFRKHGGARLAQVTFSDQSRKQPSAEEAMDNITRILFDSNIIYQDTPKVIPQVTIDTESNLVPSYREGEMEHVYVREVVVGAGEDDAKFEEVLEKLTNIGKSVGPLVYRVNASTFVRVLPSMHSTVVFSVPDLEAEQVKSESEQIFFGRIGANGMHQGQFHVTSRDPNHLRGLDIRICGNRGAPALMFAESHDSTFDGSLSMPHTNGNVSCRGMTALEGVSRVKRLWSNLGR